MDSDKDFIDIELTDKDTWFVQYCKHIGSIEEDCVAQKVPFCRPCSRIAFEDHVKEQIQLIMRKQGRSGFTDIKWDMICPPGMKNNLPVLDEKFVRPVFERVKDFIGFKYFKLLDKKGRTEAIQYSRRDKRDEMIGYHYNFVCKGYGHGYAQFVSAEEHDAWVKKHKVKAEEPAPAAAA